MALQLSNSTFQPPREVRLLESGHEVGAGAVHSLQQLSSVRREACVQRAVLRELVRAPRVQIPAPAAVERHLLLRHPRSAAGIAALGARHGVEACARADEATLALGVPPVPLSWVQLPYFQAFQLGSNGTRPGFKVWSSAR